ncbi:MAG TPA: CoA transferase [Solirubrobacterales bacterium]|jgi:crotonobetainyl-CoA:carnitine CoA-transferase CaiB-like acyl-CoA transferase|nr:CoA transferase [Solirubrobacterales bacterium]
MGANDWRPPLEGIRVVALEQFGAGPWATLQLAALGAEVIKIEDPAAGGDVGRQVPPFQEGESSLFFETFNGGKRSVSLDLRQPDGRAVFEDLVRASDVVFSNLRGDQPEKLGLRYEDLEEVNPRVVCVSLSGFGMTGPRAHEGGYDFTIQGLAGWMAITGGPDEPPTKSGISLVDFSAGYVASIAMLAGVLRARREGRGGDADLALFDVALDLLTYIGTWSASTGWTPERVPDSGHQSMVPFQAFAAADGWLVVAAPKQNLWEHMCGAIGRPELAADERFADFAARRANKEALVEILGGAFGERPVAEWVERLTAAGVPCGQVNDVAAALEDPQALAREAVVSYEHPVLGEVRRLGGALRLSGADRTPRRAPLRGEHTGPVLSELCGYSAERIEELRAAGVFGGG